VPLRFREEVQEMLRLIMKALLIDAIVIAGLLVVAYGFYICL